MPSISVPIAIAGAGALSAGASVIGGMAQADAAKSAAATQAAAANKASDQTLAMFNTTQANLKPFISGGQGAFGELQHQLPELTKTFNPTMAQLEQTPGYQFTKQQGLLGTQNSFAAQGLGTSGAAAKGAANYAENLASTTYQQQFQNYLTQNQQIYGMLSGVSGIGENAAALTGTQGLNATNQAGAFSTAGAAASAAGQVGGANALANSLGGVANTGQNLALTYALQKGGLFGTSGGGASGDDSIG